MKRDLIYGKILTDNLPETTIDWFTDYHSRDFDETEPLLYGSFRFIYPNWEIRCAYEWHICDFKKKPAVIKIPDGVYYIHRVGREMFVYRYDSQYMDHEKEIIRSEAKIEIRDNQMFSLTPLATIYPETDLKALLKFERVLGNFPSVNPNFT